MRVMFTCFPAPAHFFPMVALARALRDAGHEVVVATPPGYPSGISTPDFADLVEAAGLSVVPCGLPQPMAIHDRDDAAYAGLLPTRAESERLGASLRIPETESDAWHIFYGFGLLCARDYLPPTVRQDVRALVEHAIAWRPDLVVWESWFPAGAVAARASGARHVRFPVTPDYNGWADDRFAEVGLSDPMAGVVSPLAREYGVEVDDDLVLGERSVAFLPEGLALPRLPARCPHPLNMRYEPYNGAPDSPTPAPAPSPPPPGQALRVVISLGVSVREAIEGDWRLQRLLDAVDGLEIDVVATVDERQLSGIDRVPDNVTTHDYLPLADVLPECAVLVHHGGIGTTLAAVAAGVPQLVCDTDEQPSLTATDGPDGIAWHMGCEKQLTASLVAGFVREAGAGASIDHRYDSPAVIRARIRTLLDDPAYRNAAQRLRERWRQTPDPAEAADELARWAASPRETTTSTLGRTA